MLGLHQLTTYLGIVPRLVPSHYTGSIIHSRLAYHSRTLGIQLAGCIWGLVRRAARDRAALHQPQ